MNAKNKAGFSLVELMVVVAIIGILATVAIPNFTKFQAKAKQSSAKSELSGIFTAEKGFHAEFESFHPNLPHVGYAPEGVTMNAAGCPAGFTGQRHYVVGFAAVAFGVTADALMVGSSVPRCLGAGPNGSGNFASAYNSNNPAGTPTVANLTSGALALPALVTPIVNGANTYLIGAAGRLSNTTISDASWDAWTMDQNKVLTNTRSGL